MEVNAALPAGSVTFLFSDLEGSTRLLHQLGADYAAVLEAHQALIRTAFGDAGGVEVGTEGDSFFAVFPTAPAAVDAAVASQRALASYAWPADVKVRVRMGIHSGPAALRAGGYVGLDIHLAARISAAAAGGQVLISGVTEGLAEGALPAGVTSLSLGAHRFKDFDEPVPISQLVIDGLPDDFPPLRTLSTRARGLPLELTSFVGREPEMAAIRELVRRSRVVTLTGAAGAGKSRLAIRCAQDLLADFEDGVYFVPLAAVGEADLVAPSIARAIGLDLDPGRATDEQLVAALRERETLLVLDNFEHLLAAASIVATIVASAPRVRVLVTSRAKLRVSGEREFAVDPLPVPGPAGSGDLERLTDYGAVALFVDRAMAVNPAFRLDAANAAAVVAICRRLDGLPLAIELAAARSALLPPDALLTRLEGGLAVLSGGARDLPDRHRTLRHAIAWSVDLLSSSEQALFRRLAAFVDGFDLPAVDAVSNRSEELGLDTLDGLTALTEASLVRQVAASGEPRFAMLTTVRDFGLERLREAGDLDALTLRHAWYFLDLAERGLAGLQGEGRVRWMDRIELDRANLRAALQWAIDADEPRWGGQIAAALFEWAEGRLAMPRLPA